ncbi:MAG: ABC transporter ATP-binding protein, partial [Actinomycetes bacterium]
GDWSQVAWIIGGYLAAAVASAALISWFMVYAAQTNQQVLLDLRERLFDHTQKLSLDFHEKYTSGRVISRQTNDLDSIKELLDTSGNEMVAGILYSIFTATAMWLLDPQAFVIVLFSLVPLYFLTWWFQYQTRLGFRSTRVASAKLIIKFVETMTGIRAVKAFRKEPKNQEVYTELVEDYRSINARVIQLFGIYDPALVFIGNLTVAAVLLFGGLRVLDGSLGVRILTACLLYAR